MEKLCLFHFCFYWAGLVDVNGNHHRIQQQQGLSNPTASHVMLLALLLALFNAKCVHHCLLPTILMNIDKNSSTF